MWEIREQSRDPDNYVCSKWDGYSSSQTVLVKDVSEQLHEILPGEGEQSEVMEPIGTNDIVEIDREDSVTARGLDGVEFVKCIQEGFLKHYVDSSLEEGPYWILYCLLSLTSSRLACVRRNIKDGKKKDMEDSEIRVEHANMLGHFEIKKEVLGPNGIYL
eukprot:g34511.t1